MFHITKEKKKNNRMTFQNTIWTQPVLDREGAESCVFSDPVCQIRTAKQIAMSEEHPLQLALLKHPTAFPAGT